MWRSRKLQFSTLVFSVFYSAFLLPILLLPACSAAWLKGERITRGEDKIETTEKQDAPPLNVPNRSKAISTLELNRLNSASPPTSQVVDFFAFSPGLRGSNAEVQSGGLFSLHKNGRILYWALGSSGAVFDWWQLPKDFDQAAFCPLKLILVVAKGNRLQLYDIHERRLLDEFGGVKTRFGAIDFSKDCSSLILGGLDGIAYRLKLTKLSLTHSESERYFGHSAPISALRFLPSGQAYFVGDVRGVFSVFKTHDSDIFAGRYDENLMSGRVYTDKAERILANRTDNVSITKIILSSKADYAFLALDDGRIEVWDILGLKKEFEIKAHKGRIYDIAIDPEGKLIASVGRDAKLRIWDFRVELAPTSLVGKLEVQLVQHTELSTPNVRLLTSLSERKFLGGTLDGKVIEVTAEK